MAKITKAQARKRLQEARKKVIMVTFGYQDIGTAMFNELTKISVKLDSLSNKLK